ncbi:histone-lysine N-methyltransferase SETMAR [Trichonephila clavipes]|nr:histone-lysine N-methyltransferase SETMAR [Trichonephila clavipes]
MIVTRNETDAREETPVLQARSHVFQSTWRSIGLATIESMLREITCKVLIFPCRNCGGGDRGGVTISTSGNFAELNHIVTCMVLKPTTGVPLAPCHDEFRGLLDLTTSDSQLTAEQRNTWNVLSLSHLQLYHEEEYGFPSQIVTGDETWGHHFEPESKRQSKQWKRASSPPPKKSKVTHTSPGKVMMSFLFTTRAYRLSSF